MVLERLLGSESDQGWVLASAQESAQVSARVWGTGLALASEKVWGPLSAAVSARA